MTEFGGEACLTSIYVLLCVYHGFSDAPFMCDYITHLGIFLGLLNEVRDFLL